METIEMIAAALMAVFVVSFAVMRLDAWRRSKLTYKDQLRQREFDDENWRW